MLVNKNLPPIPIATDMDADDGEEADSSEAIERETMRSSLFPHSNSLKSPTEVSSTFALAHAALGLGLTHVIPSSASSSSSAVNTVLFASPPVSPSNPSIRKVKSSHKLRHATTDSPSNPQPERRRRSRGLSLGAPSFLNFGSPESKGKAKESVTPLPPKVIARRPSFWSRKQPISSETPVQQIPLPPNDLFIPLPLVPPSTPFIVDPATFSSSPEIYSSKHSRGLSRSHSERTKSSHTIHPSPDPPSQQEPKPRRTPRRPATADSSERAKNIDASFFESAHLLTSSPSSSPIIDSERPLPDRDYSKNQQGSPHLLQRLSLNLLASVSSTTLRDGSPAPSTSPNSSRPSLNKVSVDIPKPSSDEIPEEYLQKLSTVVGRADIAAVLASSGDSFHTQALRAYIAQFDLTDDPLDIALRRLLMDVGLPRETQQIDRVMEAFAAHYMHCNPGMFLSEDHPYILAFSLIMLHTDAFNKSNKRKMTKADYIKNTQFPGSIPEVLDCFYDNIVFAPFIFVEDPIEKTAPPLLSAHSPINGGGGSSLLGKSNKVDPYYLISNNLLGPLRVNVELHLAFNNPYNCEGTTDPWDEQALRRTFAEANVIEVLTEDQARPSSAFFNLNMATGPPNPLMTLAEFPKQETLRVKITKAGTLNRKDHLLQSGRKASNRKWRAWGVMLTGSQLLFFRDPSWAVLVLTRAGSSDTSQITVFKPDEIISVNNAIAVYDTSYTKHRHTWRFVVPDGRQFLFQASSDQELNEWMSLINYAGAFKSAGVGMRSMGMSGKDVQLTGVAAATSHLHDLQHMNQTPPRIHRWGGESSHDLLAMLSPDSDSSLHGSPVKRGVATSRDIDGDVATAPEVADADQFKATFDQVKSDLAAGKRASSPDIGFWMEDTESGSTPPSPALSFNGIPISSRSQIMQSKIRDLELRITALQDSIDAAMRVVRNIAILTPFQRSTRDRLLATVQSIAKTVDQARLDLVKLVCYRDILANDLISADRDWRLNKTLALKAATEILDGQRLVKQPPASPARSEVSHRPESTSDSFHSALDSLNWPSSDDIASLGFSDPQLATAISGARSPTYDGKLTRDMSSPRTSDELHSHEKFYTAHESLDEQAEQWNKTRCAQRVSLIRVPSDFIGLPNRFERRTDG